MIELLRKTFGLVRANPVLWLPYVVAELLATGLWRLWRIVRTEIFHWFATRHSVLGGEVPTDSYSAFDKASQVALPIGFVAVLTVVGLFVLALVATAGMGDAIGHEQKIDGSEILAGLRLRWTRILLFSLVSLVTFGAFMGGGGALLFLILRRLHRQELLTSSFSALGMITITVGCAVWLLMPMAIRLLRADRTVPIPYRTRNLGTFLAIVACEASAVVGMTLQRAEASVQLDTQFEWLVLRAFNSVVANAPDVLLFVAIALLSQQSYEMAENGGGSRVRALFQTAMPMHFREKKETE